MRPSRVVVALGLLAGAAYLFLPPSAGAVLTVSVSAAAAAALMWRGRRTERPGRQSWYLLGCGVALFAAGDAYWSSLEILFNSAPETFLGDAPYLIGYVLFAIAAMRMVRLRTGIPDRAATIDATVLALALGAVGWRVLVEPNLMVPGVSVSARISAVMYPLMDIVLLAVLVRLVLVPGRKAASLWFLIGGFGFMLLGDQLYAYLAQLGEYEVGGLADVMWIVSYSLFAAAALDRSSEELSRRSDEGTSHPGRFRVSLLSLAILVVLLSSTLHPNETDTITERVAEILVSASLSALVFWRVIRLLGQRERALESAEHREAILGAVTLATRRLLAAHYWEESLDEVLSELGDASGVDRVRLMRIHRDDGVTLASLMREWTVAGVAPSDPEAVREVPMDPELSRAFQKTVDADGATHGPVSSLPPPIARFLGAQGILSVASVPIMDGPDVWGILSYEDLHRERTWSMTDLEALIAPAAMIGGAIARQRMEERFRAMVRFSPDVIGIADAKGAVRYLSPAVESMTGIPPEDYVGRSALEFVHPDDASLVSAAFARVAGARQDSVSVEARFRHSDEAWGWGEVRFSDRRSHPGIRGIVLNVRDITDRKSMEEALREGEARIAHVLETVAEGIIIFDDEGCVARLNSAAEEMFGLPRPEVLLRRYDDPSWGITRADGSPLSEEEYPVGMVLRSGRSAFGTEIRYTRPGGEHVVWLTNAAPLPDSSGRVIGVVVSIRDVTEERLAEEQLEYRAFHDPLTSLPNRALLADRMKMAARRAERDELLTAVLYIDLDGFKGINDQHGHPVGDEVLVAMAGRIAGAVRPSDTIARVGGDEFVVLCENLHARSEAEVIAGRIVAAAAQPFEVSVGEVSLGTSVGIALAHGGEMSADGLLRAADQALYRAKRAGRGSFEFADEGEGDIPLTSASAPPRV